jgi:anthranilate synthase component I
VADSNGPYEHTEATNKARAVLNAIAAAETLSTPDAPVDDAGRGTARGDGQLA